MADFWLIVGGGLFLFGLAFQQLRERLITIQWEVEEIKRTLNSIVDPRHD